MRKAVLGSLVIVSVLALALGFPRYASESIPASSVQSLCGPVTGGAINSVAWECWNDAIFQVVNLESLDSSGWQYTLDGGDTDYAGPVGFDICGMGFRETADELWFTINAGFPLDTGYPLPEALNGSVAYGDLFINLSGLDFATAHEQGKLFAIHYAASNDAGVTQTGVYGNVTARSVVSLNNGPDNRAGYENYITVDPDGPHGTLGYGDLPVNHTYFGMHMGLNVIESGTFLGAVSFTSSEQLSAAGYNGSLFGCPITVSFKIEKQIIIDKCGVVGGDGASCRDCAGIACGETTFDLCGVCGGNNSTCLDCAGVPNGPARLDPCGVCDGDGTSCLDCAGAQDGGAVFDVCGVCGGDGSTCLDCANVPNGSSQPDACGVCGGDGTSCLDCAGVPNGTAVRDRCGDCNGDGFGCCHCTQKDISQAIAEMRSKLKKLYNLNKKTFVRLSRPNVKKAINKLSKQNSALYMQASNLIALIPLIAKECDNTEFCRDVATNQNTKAAYRKVFKKMAGLTSRIPRPKGGTCNRSSGCGAVDGSDAIRRLKGQPGTDGVPDVTSVCS